MFFGEYSYKVDEKGRVPIPPKFRRDMQESMILSRGPDKCIRAYPLSEWKKLAESLAAKAVGHTDLRRLNRAIFGSAFSASFDKQGRVILPTMLRDYAEITDEIVVVGVNNTVELWNSLLWTEEKKKSDEQVSQIIENLEA
jgi:MraZ protein